jgi:hypothetical protein
MSDALVFLLRNKKEPFRHNLLALAKEAGVSNTPRRKLFDHFADALTFTEVCQAVGGMWLLAEVEGSEVQFNPIVRDPKLASKNDIACWSEYYNALNSDDEEDDGHPDAEKDD